MPKEMKPGDVAPLQPISDISSHKLLGKLEHILKKIANFLKTVPEDAVLIRLNDETGEVKSLFTGDIPLVTNIEVIKGIITCADAGLFMIVTHNDEFCAMGSCNKETAEREFGIKRKVEKDPFEHKNIQGQKNTFCNN